MDKEGGCQMSIESHAHTFQLHIHMHIFFLFCCCFLLLLQHAHIHLHAQILEDHYGKSDPAGVAKVKQLYRDLDLETKFQVRIIVLLPNDKSVAVVCACCRCWLGW